MLAELNGWSEAEKATYLAVSLRGSALNVLTNLPEKQRRSYPALVQVLKNRFGTGHQAELNRAKLRTRLQRHDEMLPSLAEDVERLTRLSYPDAAEEMITTLSRYQFIDALQDDDTRLRVRQLRPQTLQQTLEVALELESYCLAGKQRGRPVREVREVRLEDGQKGRGLSSTGGCAGQGKVLAMLQECLQTLQGSAGTTQLTRGKEGRNSWVVCWNCRKKGHYRKDCPQPPTPRVQKETAP